MNTPIIIVQVIAAIIMSLSILLQQRGTGLGSAFGGTSNVYRTKRGIEYILYWITVVSSILFLTTSLLNLIYS